MKLIGNTADCK